MRSDDRLKDTNHNGKMCWMTKWLFACTFSVHCWGPKPAICWQKLKRSGCKCSSIQSCFTGRQIKQLWFHNMQLSARSTEFTFFFFFLIPCTFKLLESFAVMNWWWACCGCQVIQEWGCSIPELVLILGIPTLSSSISELSEFLLCSKHVHIILKWYAT